MLKSPFWHLIKNGEGGAGTPKINPTPYLILGINVSKYKKTGSSHQKISCGNLCVRPQTEDADDDDNDNVIT